MSDHRHSKKHKSQKGRSSTYDNTRDMYFERYGSGAPRIVYQPNYSGQSSLYDTPETTSQPTSHRSSGHGSHHNSKGSHHGSRHSGSHHSGSQHSHHTSHHSSHHSSNQGSQAGGSAQTAAAAATGAAAGGVYVDPAQGTGYVAQDPNPNYTVNQAYVQQGLADQEETPITTDGSYYQDDGVYYHPAFYNGWNGLYLGDPTPSGKQYLMTGGRYRHQ